MNNPFSIFIHYIALMSSVLILLLYAFQVWSLSQLPHTVLYTDVPTLPSDTHIPTRQNLPVLSATTTTERTKILFMGDVMLGRNVEYLADLHGRHYLTDAIVGTLPTADAVVANFESAMSVPHVRTRAYTTQFSTATSMLPVLATLGVTHVSLANNHSLDFGNQGYKNTVSFLRGASIEPFGHPDHISSSSITYIGTSPRVAIMGLNTISQTLNREELTKQLSALAQQSALQIAYVHWGNEYESVHSMAQRELAEFLVSQGVDVIIGHHPHVVQDIERIESVPVFYSLGNFIFDQYFSEAVQEGFALLLEIATDGNLAFTIIPTTSQDVRSQPRVMGDTETINFLEGLADRSEQRWRDQILTNTITATATLRASENEVLLIDN